MYSLQMQNSSVCVLNRERTNAEKDFEQIEHQFCPRKDKHSHTWKHLKLLSQCTGLCVSVCSNNPAITPALVGLGVEQGRL